MGGLSSERIDLENADRRRRGGEAYFGKGARATLIMFPFESGEPVKAFDVQMSLPVIIRWAPDSSAITYVSREGSFYEIWSQPVGGGPPKKLTNFKTDQIFDFDWSRDGKLLIAHGSSTADLVLIQNEK